MLKRFAVLILMFLLILCSCKENISKTQQEKESKEGYHVGVWISYFEVNEMLKNGYKDDFLKVIENCKQSKISDIFLHTIAFCDPIYKSSYHPQNEYAKSLNFDPLDYSATICKQNNIRLHAWINPYRVSTATSDVNELNKESVAYLWTHDENTQNDKNVSLSNGIYLNPAESDTRCLVINCVREICENYEIAGIHFDDYFYPTTEENFDKGSYEEYKLQNENPLSLAEFRRANVNGLISGAYTAIKFIDKDLLFSVSPAASIDKNYNSFYADVALWAREGCVDMLIPQLYFGFNYEDQNFRFENLIANWKNITEGTNTKLVIGLASYKIGSDKERDKDFLDADTIPKQVALCVENKDIAGHSFYSYSSFMSDNPLNKTAREKSIIK